MKHPIILGGPGFDWDAGEKAAAEVGDDDGSINWYAAFSADPGVMSCPVCKVHLWNEGYTAKCPDCGHEWRTRSGVHFDEEAERRRGRGR